ncbi:hypothetical protein IJG79_02890 [Candidatus Saccharibacteria bacterium]|nr:hypothetical protein [Candidatus Saccharibacteria bacterium]
MDNKEYLESIAKDTRSAGPAKTGAFSIGSLTIPPVFKKILLGIGIALVVLLIVAIIVGIAGSGGNKERDYIDKIYLRSSHLVKETGTYNKLVKSSQLRSMGTSLLAVLNETQFSMSNILKNDFGATTPDTPENEKTTEEENAVMVEYLNTLENARLNGTLDRVYARELTYQIGMLLSLEHEAYANTKKDNLKSALTTSMNNLNQLYTQFGDFSTK